MIITQKNHVSIKHKTPVFTANYSSVVLKLIVALFAFTVISPVAQAMTVKVANAHVLSATYNNERDNNNPAVLQSQRDDNANALAQALTDQRQAITDNKQLKADISAKKGLHAPVINPTSYRLGIAQLQQVVAGTLNITDVTVDHPDNATINVSVTSLHPSALVSVSINGVTHMTTAGMLAEIDPNLQVAVPHVPALIAPQNNAGHTDKTGSASHGGSGRGSDNAHSHAFGGQGYGANNSKSQGFGGNSHFH